MTPLLETHLGGAYSARVMGQGSYERVLSNFRGQLQRNPTLRAEALAERGRLEYFLTSIPGDEHKRCFASVENLQTLKDALNGGQ